MKLYDLDISIIVICECDINPGRVDRKKGFGRLTFQANVNPYIHPFMMATRFNPWFTMSLCPRGSAWASSASSSGLSI